MRNYSSVRLTIGFVASLILCASGAWAGGLFGSHGSSAPTLQTISSVTLGGTHTFVAGSSDGTTVGSISTVLSPPLPLFVGTYSVGGTDASSFRISGSDLVTNGVQSAASYSVTLTATPTDTTIPPFTTAAITITTPGQRIAAVNLTAANFPAGSASGTTIGTLSAAMLPTSPLFSPGAFTIDPGGSAGSFQISGTSLQTNGVLCPSGAPCSYVITVRATHSNSGIAPFSQNFTLTAEASSPPAGVTVLLTTPGAGSWTVPSNWTSANNSIEAIGGGAGGGTSGGGNDAGGGGGGACSSVSNLALTAGASISYQIGAGGPSGNSGGDTSFNSTTVVAKGGASTANAIGGLGGQASAGTGATKFSGGNGGTSTNSQSGGDGGGGAASCSGAGKPGGPSAFNVGSGGGAAGGGVSTAGVDGSADIGGQGGTASDGTAGGSGATSQAPASPGLRGSGGGGGYHGNGFSGGAPGGAGSEWDASHGPGGGGGGGGFQTGSGTGGQGGSYGGGGGGSAFAGLAGGSGAQGGIKITYGGTPSSQTIAQVTLSNNSITSGPGSANQTIGLISTGLQPSTPAFNGSYSLTGPDAGKFAILGSALKVSGTDLPATTTNYSINIIATQAGISNSPFALNNVTIAATAPTASQSISSVNLDNAQFTAGAGSANSLIGHVSTTMNSAPGFSGSYGQTNGNLALSNCTSSTCDLRVGTADQPPATYTTTITATPSNSAIAPKSQGFTISGNGPAGAGVTTYTLQNASSSIIPAGTVYIAGQSFRRGDFPPGTYPVFRGLTTHAPLVQQLDEVATRRENGDDNSIRHLVFSVQLPAAVPANGTYTMEVVKQTGTYVPSSTKQTLTALCAAHTLKLDLTDVRNQDATVRDSGHMTFDVCSNIGNTGRDAPRHVAQGPVRDTYIVRGAPTYATSGNKDPMLYVEAYLDLTTLASDQTSLGQVRHVMRVSSPWMNVRSGNAGNSGAPGPVGFTNDPQAISYRPQLLDGASNLLDWSWYDQTIASGSNPIMLAGNPAPSSCAQTPTDIGNWTVPGSVGDNSWYHGMALQYSTAGTPPAGMTNNKLIFVDGVGAEYSFSTPSNTQIIHLSNVPSACEGSGFEINPTTQGSGNQVFSYRVWHPKWLNWKTLDQTGLENWTNGTARTTSPLLPSFTPTELTYWEQTGTVPPLKITSPVDTATIAFTDYNYPINAPMAIGIMGGVSSPSERSPLGLTNEHFAQAILLQTPAAWRNARLAALSFGAWSFGTMLDERTARIPAFNNGPPAANHAGGGTAYTEGSLTLPIFASTVDLFDGSTMDGLTAPRSGTPQASYSGYAAGPFGAGRHFSNDHKPSWGNGIYQIFGSEHYLADVYQIAASTVPPVSTGDLVSHQTDTVNGVRYHGLHQNCCEIRGTWWATRDKMNCAAYGSDAYYERRFCNDMLVENYYYYIAKEAWIDGTSTNFRSDAVPPDIEQFNASFKDAYGGMVDYTAYAILRDPLAQRFLNKLTALLLARCAGVGTGSYGDGYWCASYNYMANMKDTSKQTGGYPIIMFVDQNAGQFFVSDFTEMGESPSYLQVGPANDGTLNFVDNGGDFPNLFFSNGDKMKSIRPQQSDYNPAPDQLDPAVWYTITNIVKNPDGAVKSVKLINPATAAPFTSFTYKGGSPLGQLFYLKTRPTDPSDSPSTGFHSLGYTQYLAPVARGLHSLGFSAIDPVLAKLAARGYVDAGFARQKFSWNENITVP